MPTTSWHEGGRADHTEQHGRKTIAKHCHVVVEDTKPSVRATNGCWVYSFMVRSASRHTDALMNTSTILPTVFDAVVTLLILRFYT